MRMGADMNSPKLGKLSTALILKQSRKRGLSPISLRTGNFKKALSNLLQKKLLKRTIPEVPRSKKQKYRLTSKGISLLEGLT